MARSCWSQASLGLASRASPRHWRSASTLSRISVCAISAYRITRTAHCSRSSTSSAGHRGSHTTIRLPDRITRFLQLSANFAWYKVALTHRAAHYEGGTFDFVFDRDARHFPRLRPVLRDVTRYERESDLETFFRLFAQREVRRART